MRRKIIKEMNGFKLGQKVKMKSQNGESTTFTIAVLLNIGKRKKQNVPPGRYARLYYPSGLLTGLIHLGEIEKCPGDKD